VCVFCVLFVSVFPCLVLVWFFLLLSEEELTLLFLLHRENGDFSIIMKDIFGFKVVQRSHLSFSCVMKHSLMNYLKLLLS
jgi:hypothetical protein